MGGFGSGQKWNSKTTTSDMLTVDVRKWQRQKLIQANSAFTTTWTMSADRKNSISLFVENESKIIFSYTSTKRTGEKTEHNYPVYIERTPCNYGGVRVWFKCPCCYKRVAKLYGGEIYACRTCQNLTYDSQRESNLDLIVSRMNRLRAKLAWRGGIYEGEGSKPKGMRWTTYFKLNAEYCRMFENMSQAFKQKFNSDYEN